MRAASLSRIRTPLLALNGTLGRQVPADEDLSAIKTALAYSADVSVGRLDGLNHPFQNAPHRAIGEYADTEEMISPVVLSRDRVDRGPVQTKRASIPPASPSSPR